MIDISESNISRGGRRGGEENEDAGKILMNLCFSDILGATSGRQCHVIMLGGEDSKGGEDSEKDTEN